MNTNAALRFLFSLPSFCSYITLLTPTEVVINSNPHVLFIYIAGKPNIPSTYLERLYFLFQMQDLSFNPYLILFGWFWPIVTPYT